jgi:etoposide-induced 2.4 mRNA
MDPLELREAPSMEGNGEKLKEFFAQLVMLWWAGVREACCLHRVLFFCKRSRILLKRTGQCFLLNGCIFLGSIFLVKIVITPALQWILPVNSQHQVATDVQYCPIAEAGERFYSLLQAILITLFYVLWFYPMYVFSFIISSIWYNEIAKQACIVMKESEEDPQKSNSGKDKVLSTEAAINHDGLEGMMLMIGEQIYSVLMLTIFFLEVSGVGYIPYIGKIMNFILQSWIYAYYCFEYKWNFIEWNLDKRIYFFETNWAFFAGFGSPCVLATFFSSQLISSGIMAILFPLFVLSATAAHPEQVIDTFSRRWTHNRLRQVPLFYVPNATSFQALRFLSFIGKKISFIGMKKQV